MEEKKTKVSRREFLKDAGLVVGGATIGSAAILSACSGKTETVTKTVTNTVTKTDTKSEYVCPVDSQKFSTLADLQAHYQAEHAGKQIENLITLNVNGKDYTMVVEPWWPLAYVLRDVLGFYSVKLGCDFGNCGTCTIHADGIPMFACLMLAVDCEGMEIKTLEAFSNGGELDPVQTKFYEFDALQCGYCTPGLIMAGEALIKKNPKPTAADVQEAFSGHLCFCANMTKQVECLVGGVD